MKTFVPATILFSTVVLSSFSATPFAQKTQLEFAVSQQNHEASRSTIRSARGDRRGERRTRKRASRDRNHHPFNFANARSYDGSNNNQSYPHWGASFSHLQRLGNTAYADGISAMAGELRASARLISNEIAHQASGESIRNSFDTSDYVWQWGQFINHDISLTEGLTTESSDIVVPVFDAYFDPAGTGTQVIGFNRAPYDPETGTDPSNPRQQENELSSWIDGSMVYGSGPQRAAALRAGPDSPFLKTSAGNLLPFNTDGLDNANGFVTDPAALFVAGDVRANEQVGLTALHTLFVREHNRIAKELARRLPDSSADEIFERTRRLVVAKIQIITYEEFLPALLGSDAIDLYSGYDSSIDPTISNEFSAAAFCLGHSMVNETLLRLDKNGEVIDDGNLSLRNSFFTGNVVLQEEDDIDPILRGLAGQRHQRIDVQIIEPLRNFLVGSPGSGGFDLASINIQRGRDHGLPSYNDARAAMGLSRHKSFSDITNDNSLSQALQGMYGSVDDIDLWVGGLAESTPGDSGSQLGSLFHEIVKHQFSALRDGDRFWYENYLSDNELYRVQDTTLSKVIRANTNIGLELPRNVFKFHGNEPAPEPNKHFKFVERNAPDFAI